MDYRKITNISSAQWKLIHSDEIRVCSDGLLRDEDGFIGVAMGRYYQTSIGDRFIVTLDTGNKLKLISVDQKADCDTINGANHKTDNSMVEFVIDVDKARNTYKIDIVMGNFNYSEEFHGNIVKIEKVVEV